jgi:hypothetical protein
MTDVKIIGEANHLLSIDEIFVFVTKDATGNEGVAAFNGPNNMVFPMVCADKARVDSLRPIAVQIAEHTGCEIKLIRFSNREELETITPEATKQ